MDCSRIQKSSVAGGNFCCCTSTGVFCGHLLAVRGRQVVSRITTLLYKLAWLDKPSLAFM